MNGRTICRPNERNARLRRSAGRGRTMEGDKVWEVVANTHLNRFTLHGRQCDFLHKVFSVIECRGVHPKGAFSRCEYVAPPHSQHPRDVNSLAAAM